MADDTPTVSELVVTAPSKAKAALRRPRAQMLVDGAVVVPMHGKITRTNDLQADTFSLEFSLTADKTKDIDWWMNREGLDVDIQLGLEDNGVVGWKSSLTGIVDKVKVDLLKLTVSIDGRDRTALYDEKTFEAYPNKTSSEVVTALAAKHGMTANVQKTTTNIGVFYANDHIHVAGGEASRSRKEWDLLTYLARKEGFAIWVEGNTLNFKDIEQDPEVRYLAYKAPAVSDGLSTANDSYAEELSISHDFNRAKDIKVVVRSWHARLGKKHVAVRKKTPLPGKNATAGSGGKNAKTYYYTRAGLTPEQAQEYANQRFKELTHGEFILEWAAPGDLSYTPRQVLKFDDAPSSFLDKDYYIEEVSFEFGFGKGFTMSIRAKSLPPPSEVGAEGEE